MTPVEEGTGLQCRTTGPLEPDLLKATAGPRGDPLLPGHQQAEAPSGLPEARLPKAQGQTQGTSSNWGALGPQAPFEPAGGHWQCQALHFPQALSGQPPRAHCFSAENGRSHVSRETGAMGSF